MNVMYDAIHQRKQVLYTRSHTTGFTIVELLIVIVIIAILAAITIVAYSGIQNRAEYSIMQNDLESVNKVILLYYTDNGYYPYSGSGGGNTGGSITNIPGLIPTYTSRLPTFPKGVVGYYVYVWSAYGADYKLLRLVPDGTPLLSVEQSNANLDPARPGRGWGYWSSGGGNL